ncbi:MAG TPA: phage tail tube protein, partial [Candidatus Limnocylindrales bacterium]
MGNLQDCSINIKPETTYKTGVTPDRAFRFTSETLDWNPTIVQGEGLKVGTYMDLADERVVPSGQGGGDINFQVGSKGFGYLWQACLGTATSTVVLTSTYQQVHTWAKQPSSLTIQKTSVEAGGTVDPVTFKGCSVTQWQLTFANQGLVTLQVSVDAGDYDTVTGFAALSYPSTPNLFHFANWTNITGVVTPATTTALATASTGTALAGVRSLTITGNRNPVVDRFNAIGTGRKDQPIGQQFDVTGSLEIEYQNTTQRDAYLAQT